MISKKPQRRARAQDLAHSFTDVFGGAGLYLVKGQLWHQLREFQRVQLTFHSGMRRRRQLRLVTTFQTKLSNQVRWAPKEKSYCFLSFGARLSLVVCVCIEKMRRLYWWFEWPIKNLVLALYSILYSPISITWLLNLSSRSSPSTMNSTVRAWPRQICSNLFLFLGANLH